MTPNTRKVRKKTGRRTAAKNVTVNDEKKLVEGDNVTTCKIALDSNLTIANSENLKSILLESLGNNKVEIDATSVEQIDTSCVQLLVSYIKMLENQSIELEWKGVSEPLVNTVKYLGLTKHLKI